MSDKDLIYKIALSMIDGIDARFVRAMTEVGLTFEDFFLLDIDEISRFFKGKSVNRDVIDSALDRASCELSFIKQHSIRALFLTDDEYPRLLREIPDAPIVLYVLGNANLDVTPSIGMVGTRKCTSYGLNFCDYFVSELSNSLKEGSIVSGLAYGIDAAAHTAALKYGVNTIAVVAHGLDMIYPAANRELARRIIADNGAIVTEYPTSTRPLQGNFLKRNRIIAGLCDMTFVVESDVKGGAMSTASSAFSYSREVVALPGRYSDVSSSGCNMLIKQQKANIFTSVSDIIKLMGWTTKIGNGKNTTQKSLFPELDADAAKIYDFLRHKACSQSIDQIHNGTGINMANLISQLTEMEFDSLLRKLPGSRYELN